MEDFFEREGGDDGQFPIPQEHRTQLLKTSTGCDKRKKSMYRIYCLETLKQITSILI